MSYLDRIDTCRVFDPAASRPFCVNGAEIGRVGHDLARRLTEFADVFTVADDRVTLTPHLDHAELRSAAVDGVLRMLADEGWFRGWRDEPYAVTPVFGRPPLFVMERAAVPAFGVRGYGLHVNGIVRRGGDTHMWIGRRALDRRVEPGKLDQMVAGGQPAGLSLAQNLRKEAAEEAGIPPEMADTARFTSVITYRTQRTEGLRNDVLFVYDLEVPADFEPRNTDGEIAGFECLPLDQVAAMVRDGDVFKFNCSLVVIDYLLRHGRLDPDDSESLAIAEGLRSGVH